MIPEYKTRIEKFTCQIHGEGDCEIFKLSREWSNPFCQKCQDEADAAQKAEEQKTANYMAEQQKAARAKYRLEYSGIPERFAGKGFHDFSPPNEQARKIADRCREYAEAFPQYWKRGTGAILSGGVGTGKTHLASAMVGYINRNFDLYAMMTKTAVALRKVKDTYNNRDNEDGEQAVLNYYKKPDLLVLDELGVHFGSDAEKLILFEIVNERYEAMKPTIFLTNLALNVLAEYAGERVLDRMRENGGKVMLFEWDSHR